MATGALDAVLTSAEAGLPGKLDESLKFYYDYNTGLNVASINLDLFNDLSAEQQRTLRQQPYDREPRALPGRWRNGRALSDQSPELSAAFAQAAAPDPGAMAGGGRRSSGRHHG